MKKKIVILGAGVTGLTAGYQLSQDENNEIIIIEELDRVGGLATSYNLNNSVFDFGPHAFHSQEPHIINFFKNLMNGDFNEISKNVAIKFQDRLYDYPLNPIQALKNMPLKLAIKCGLSYLWNVATNLKSIDDLKTSEELFVKRFGWELYRIFFETYTEKVWGIHPRNLSIHFMKNRLPAANIFQIIKTAVTGVDVKTTKPNEVPLKLQIFYPKKGSKSFPDKMLEFILKKGGKIHLNSEVKSIERSSDIVTGVNYSQHNSIIHVKADCVIATIPLNQIINNLNPIADEKTRLASQELNFRPILIVCLVIKKDQIFPYQTVYFTNRIFNRLAQMNSYSTETVPQGYCGVTAEITLEGKQFYEDYNESSIIKKVINDMEAEKLIREGDVIDSVILKNSFGYPIYKVGFEENLITIRNYIKKINNLFVGGRQGMFNYAQMHYGVNSGLKIAEFITEKKPKPEFNFSKMEEHFFN